jgi:glycogen(starch) synthase
LNIGFIATESPYDFVPRGGIAAYLRAMIPAFLDAGHRVTLFAAAGETNSFLAENGRLKVYHLRLPSTHWYAAKVPVLRNTLTLPLRQIEWSLAFYRCVASVAAHEKFDVLECTEVGALFLNRLAPVVVRLHGSELAFRKHAGLPTNMSVRFNDLLERRGCEKAAAITSPSLFQASETAERRGWAFDRFRVIPNPISREMLEASSQPGLPGDHQDQPVLLYAGRLAPVKGIEPLLAAARQVRTKLPGATFVLAGPWQMAHEPSKYGLELNRKSADGVLWIGPRTFRELAEWYRRATLFVMPSYFESFGISVVEAMAFGLPVVATTGGALTEVVHDGMTGQLVPPGDVAALADAILKLVSDSETRRRMSKLGPERVRNNFTVEHAYKATLQVYSAAQGNDEFQLNEAESKANLSSLRVRA